MSKLTLLKIVNNTLNALEATKVSTIDETVESSAIVEIAEECFYEMVSQGDWPHLNELKVLDSLADSTKPNYLAIPEDVKEIKYLEYAGKRLNFIEVEKFLEISNSRDLSSDFVVEVEDHSGYTFKVANNKNPECFTIINDKYVVTDSFDEEVESTLQSSKSVAEVIVIPSWTNDDSFIPALTSNMFPTYLALVKRAAFLYLRREQSLKDERAAIAGMGRLYRKESKLNLTPRVKNYGR